MMGYIDLHCHILPGIDDGSKDFDETFRMLYIAYKEGIRVIVATLHYRSDHPSPGSLKVKEIFDELNAEIEKAGIIINIILGNEILFSSDTVEALRSGEALSIDGTRYILVEFPAAASFRELWNGLSQCIYSGYIPVLAHVERYSCLVREPDLVEELIHLGTYIQMNLSAVKGKITDPIRHFSHRLLKRRMVHFLGTDAHGAYDRTPKAEDYIRIIAKHYGEELVEQLLWENPMTMLEDKHL